MPKLYSYGFPGLYAGASTELHHQFHAWSKIHEIDLAIIPQNHGYKNEPLYKEMLDLGVEITEPHQFARVKPEDAVINFCSDLFLDNVPHIEQFTKRTIFVNCMTWLFKDEKKRHTEGHIGFSLYQRPQILMDHEQELRLLGSKADFLHFVPYFHAKNFDYQVKDDEYTHIGRISRDDKDKYTSLNGLIYDRIVSPKLKRGHYMGYGAKALSVTGELPKWITTYANQSKLPVRDFYNLVDFIVQPTNTTENWPRIGLESMWTGKPLVVDNRGGWQYMIDHGKTGFLCNNERDFIYWGSRLAYEPELRNTIAENAYQKAQEISSLEASVASWRKVFERVFN